MTRWPLMVCLAAGISARASGADVPLDRALHETWTVASGLPQNSVLAATQSLEGYLWFATHEGLARFDGARFVVFDRTRSEAFRRNTVRAVTPRRAGGVFFSNQGRVGFVHGDEVTIVARVDSPDPPEGWSIVEDGEGLVWLGTRTHGVFVVRGGRLERPGGGEELRQGLVPALAVSRDGTVWVASAEFGLHAFRSGAEVSCPSCEHLPRGALQAAAPGLHGGVWVGGDQGLFFLRATDAAEPIRTNVGKVSAVVEGLSGLWVGLERGVIRLDGESTARGEITAFAATRQIAEPGVTATSLLEDHEGSIWAGTTEHGLHRLRSAAFWFLDEHQGLPASGLTQIALAGGALWALGEAGVYRSPDGRDWRRLSAPPGDTPLRVVEAHGAIWMGTDAGRLLRVDAGRIVLSTVTLPSKARAHLLTPSNAGLWVGQSDGSLSEIVNGRVARRVSLGTPHGITGVHEWPDGRLWIASHRGLFEWSATGLTDLTERLLSPSVILTGMLADGDSIWLTSDADGLFRFRAGRMSSLRRAQGLFDDVLFGLLDDGRGNFWSTSNKGIVRMSKAELNAVAEGRLQVLTPRVFTEADGLKIREAAGGGAARSHDGLLWFPTIAGIAVTDPAAPIANRISPRVLIERVRADGVAVPDAGTIPPGVGTIAFEYTAFSFRSPARVRFQYRLEGFESGWNEAGPQRVAIYRQLPRGSYRFLVRAENEDGIMSAAEASLSFSVAPRWHETWEARLAFALAIAGAMTGLVRLRTRAARERQRALAALVDERTRDLAIQKERAEAASVAKTRFVASVSHELRTPLSVILGFTELLGRPLPAERRSDYLRLIRSNAVHLRDLVNSVLSLTRIEAGHGEVTLRPFSLPGLVHEVVDGFAHTASSRGLALEVQGLDAMPEVVSGDAPKLRQILVNLISNALKFTETGSVTLRVRAEEASQAEAVEFQVIDTGPGIPQDQRDSIFGEFVQGEEGIRRAEGAGLGLAISRRLAIALGGSLELGASSPGGSVFVLRLPLPKAAARLQSAGRVAGALPSSATPTRVLVADDAPALRQLLVDLHRLVGIEAIEASSGPEAFEAFLRDRPRLVWTDAMMPGFGGAELTRRIRAEESARSWPRTPIVAVTASALGEERAELLSIGCDRVIVKPFAEEEIFGALESSLGVSFDRSLGRGETLAPGSGGNEGLKVALREEARRLRAAAGSADRSGLRRAAHDLKGACGVLGMEPLAFEAGELEVRLAGDAPLQEARATLLSLADQLEKAASI